MTDRWTKVLDSQSSNVYFNKNLPWQSGRHDWLDYSSLRKDDIAVICIRCLDSCIRINPLGCAVVQRDQWESMISLKRENEIKSVLTNIIPTWWLRHLIAFFKSFLTRQNLKVKMTASVSKKKKKKNDNTQNKKDLFKKGIYPERFELLFVLSCLIFFFFTLCVFWFLMSFGNRTGWFDFYRKWFCWQCLLRLQRWKRKPSPLTSSWCDGRDRQPDRPT